MKTIIALLVVTMSFPALADVKCGRDVEFLNDMTVVDGQDEIDLILNGVGLKKVFIFNVFYSALYVENLNDDGQDLIDNDEKKALVIHALRDITADQLVENWDSEFNRLCDDMCDELQPFHDQFIGEARDVSKDERITVEFLSDRIQYRDESGHEYDPIMSVEYGRKIMLASAVGDDAGDENVKKGMLGEHDKICDPL